MTLKQNDERGHSGCRIYVRGELGTEDLHHWAYQVFNVLKSELIEHLYHPGAAGHRRIRDEFEQTIDDLEAE